MSSTRDQETVKFSRILEDHVSCLVGQPRSLLADPGSSVENNLIDRSVAEVTNTGKTQVKKQRVNCSDCNQSFRKKSELTRHYQSKHQGLKWHCVDCGRIYKSRKNLKRHCRKRHPSVESTGTVETDRRAEPRVRSSWSSRNVHGYPGIGKVDSRVGT